MLLVNGEEFENRGRWSSDYSGNFADFWVKKDDSKKAIVRLLDQRWAIVDLDGQVPLRVSGDIRSSDHCPPTGLRFCDRPFKNFDSPPRCRDLSIEMMKLELPKIDLNMTSS